MGCPEKVPLKDTEPVGIGRLTLIGRGDPVGIEKVGFTEPVGSGLEKLPGIDKEGRGLWLTGEPVGEAALLETGAL